jgi:ubiquinone/menaquinone biosynthesis C-methylase UbiE
MPYPVESYWSGVADEIRKRRSGRHVAGDDDPYFRYKRGKFLKRFLSSLAVEGRTVLELGCGPGGNLRELAARRPAALIGLDISASMLALAAETLAGAPTPVELKKTDGRRLPVSDRSVDLAFTVTVLQHNVDPVMLSQVVGELCRITSGQVVGIEDTGTSEPPAEGDTFVARPIDAYRVEFARHGFRLTSAAYLNLRFSRGAHQVLRRRLVPVHHREGQPLGILHRLLLTGALAVTRHLDDARDDHQDLTMMVFARGK